MAERHRAEIEFVEWNRGYLPGSKGYRKNPPGPIRGAWFQRRVRGRTVLYQIGPGELMTDSEAAAVLGVTRQTIRNWRVSGQLRAEQRAKTWYFTYEDVCSLCQKRHGEPKRIYFVN